LATLLLIVSASAGATLIWRKWSLSLAPAHAPT
jgi:hypothetical protein